MFKQALDVAGHAPAWVTTDGHDSYPRAIHETLGRDVLHRTNRSLNNRLEQDHRGIKQRYYPMRGFGSVASTARFCRAFDELRHSFRPHHTMGEKVSLAQQQQLFCERLAGLQTVMVVASSSSGSRVGGLQPLPLPFSVLTLPVFAKFPPILQP